MTKIGAEIVARGDAGSSAERVGKGVGVDVAAGPVSLDLAPEAASAMPPKGGVKGADVVMAKDSELLSRRALSKDDRDSLCLLFTDRERIEKEDAISDRRFWERLLHSGSFDSILESAVDVRCVPQDMRRGRPTAALKEQIAVILDLPAVTAAQTWSEVFLAALGSDLVVEVLSLARPPAKATYLLQRVLLCRHLGLHPEQEFRFKVRSKGSSLHFELAAGTVLDAGVRLLVEGLELRPNEISSGSEGIELTFHLPSTLDAARSIFGSLAIGERGAEVFPNIAFRINRSSLPAADGMGGGHGASPMPALVRAGRFLHSESKLIRVHVGARELPAEKTAGEGAVWRLGKSSQVDEGRRIRVLTEDREALWAGNWSDIPEHVTPVLDLKGERLVADAAGLTVSLLFDEDEEMDFLVDGELMSDFPAPGSIQWTERFVRTLVFETPVALMDGGEHTVCVRIRAQDDVREFHKVVRIAPTAAEWASLLQARGAIPLIDALLRKGRSGLVDEVLASHGATFSDDLLTDILLVRIVHEGGVGLSAPIQDALAGLWLRTSRRPRGLEQMARRILTVLPKAAASEEWRILAQLPIKEAMADLAILLSQIGDATAVRLAADVQTHLFRLGRHALANQVVRNLSTEEQASPEIERTRLRDLRRLGGDEAAALALDMLRRKVKAPDVQRVLVDSLVRDGKYLEAAAVSTEAQGVSRFLSRSAVHRRMARDTFPLGWVQWAAASFEGANDDAERTLSRLAAAQSPSVDGSISIFLTSPATERTWPRRYFDEVDPAPALGMAAPGETCGALPAITEWTLVLHGGVPVSPASLNTVLMARREHEDLILIYLGGDPADGTVSECGFLVRTKHLQFVSRMLPRAAAPVLARNLKHRSLLVASESRQK